MPNSVLSRQVRSALENAPDALPLNDLLSLVGDFVLECSASDEPEVLLFQFEEELQVIHHDVVDYTSLRQMETFVAILYHLRPVLPATSVISWFDVVLRPALREVGMSAQAVNQAKDLIVLALQKTTEAYAQRVNDFRRRLFEFWLLDAFNEASMEDVLEWAELQPEERTKRTLWKQNLGDILLRFSNERPKDFLDEINTHFQAPTARRQLISLFHEFMDLPKFIEYAKILPQHAVMDKLVLCLYFDNSSTVCASAVTLLARLIPYIAACDATVMKHLLPQFLAILVRIMLWKERPDADEFADDTPSDPELDRELEKEANKTLRISPKITWERLETMFNRLSVMKQVPHSRSLFTILYYLFPSNVLRFLRNPVQYLVDKGLESPFVETWAEAFRPLDLVRRIAENLLREHCSHPLLIWRDAVAELDDTPFWGSYSLSRIVSESSMLDTRKLTVGVRARMEAGEQLASFNLGEAQTRSGEQADDQLENETDAVSISKSQLTVLQPVSLSPEKIVIRLDDMIKTSIALRSGMDIVVEPPSGEWAGELVEVFASVARFHGSPTEASEGAAHEHITETLTSLQRELLLLRNELNFELWLSRENAKHIGQLYQDRILIRTAEAERQGLYNKLRKYRAQVLALEAELSEHRLRASKDKGKYADWNTELQQKLKELRDEKRKWALEAATLRSAEKEARALFYAQGKLLAEATQEVSNLETRRKENQHKIDRLRDYERQIEQHLKVQKLWNDDFSEFQQRGKAIQDMQSRYMQMHLRLQGMEQTLAAVERQGQRDRLQIQGLEAKLKQTTKRGPRQVFEEDLRRLVSEKQTLSSENHRLRDENDELKDAAEEMRALVEELRNR